jgi:hypothetical protein
MKLVMRRAAGVGVVVLQPPLTLCWRTKICDTPRARENDAQPPIVTMLCCPGTSTCRMYPIQ